MEKVPKLPIENTILFKCEICDYITEYNKDLAKHNLTLKHKKRIKEIEGNEKLPENSAYYCKSCDYKTIHKKDFIKHENTKRHIMINEGIINNTNYACIKCNKLFKSNSGLWKHTSHCCNEEKIENIEEITNTEEKKNNTITTEMFMEFVKQSKELQNVLIEQNKELQNKLVSMAQSLSVVNNNTMTNSNNKQFNLQFFLNETCKDAINISDFINSLELNVEDFEATGRLGYVEGISRIIINGMRDMEVEKRPMHCTDFKRETLYIKDDNVWTKENSDKNKFKKVVKKVAQLNLNQLPKWQAKHPDCVKINTWENDQYLKLSLAALGSRSNEEEEKFVDKIMKNVLKEVVVNKK